MFQKTERSPFRNRLVLDGEKRIAGGDVRRSEYTRVCWESMVGASRLVEAFEWLLIRKEKAQFDEWILWSWCNVGGKGSMWASKMREAFV
jgi:hypothetical protein